MSGKPMVFTEFGYHTFVGNPARPGHWQGVDEEAQAILLINGWLDAAANGVARTYIYQLLDGAADREGAPTQENHFGLFRYDGGPKPAATAFKNLLTLAADWSLRAHDFPLAPLSVRVSADRPVNVLPLRDAAGRTLLLIWNEAPLWNAEASARRETEPFNVSIALPREAVMAVWDILDFKQLTDDFRGQSLSVSMTARPLAVRLV